jgi:hypothetical protein
MFIPATLKEFPMKHVFIVNPVSGKGKAKRLVPLIEDRKSVV